MFGDFLLLEDQGGSSTRQARRLELGETAGRNEAWLRDTLFDHPEILPLRDIEPSYGPLIPLCKELRTPAGPVDVAYINPHGRLTLVECKLWRNPEARRKVIAQTLDYARAIASWSYADLQRQVSAATGRKGDAPFELARRIAPELQEHLFADQVTRSLRAGRFLLLIAGDGIREDIGGMAELINRNAASAYSLGLVEVALYDIGQGGLAIQPRVIARTQLIERTVVVIRDGLAGDEAEPSRLVDEDVQEAPAGASQSSGVESPLQAVYRAWWAPVIAAPFDDPEQEPATLRWPNNIRARLPYPGAWVTAYRSEATGTLGVFLAGKNDALSGLWERLQPQLDELIAELPDETQAKVENGKAVLQTVRSAADFPDDQARQAWLASTLNRYVTALRSRIS